MKITRKCAGCKKDFPKVEMVEYFSPSGKTSNWFCPKCLAEKQGREYFSQRICYIFNLKSPGPIIWTQRKRLQDTYGYTDETILECLDYMYNVENYRKLSETLALVTPTNVEKMKKYKRNEEYKKTVLLDNLVASQNYEEKQVKVREAGDRKEMDMNPDDFLED